MLLIVTTLSACGNTLEPEAGADKSGEGTESTEGRLSAENEDAEEPAGEVISMEEGILKLYGPGLFTVVGQDGSADLVTGTKKPGYQVIIDRYQGKKSV